MKRLNQDAIKVIQVVAALSTGLLVFGGTFFGVAVILQQPEYRLTGEGRISRNIYVKLPTTLTDDTQAFGHSIEIRYKPIHNLKTEKTANQIVLSSNYGTTNSQMESKLDSTKDPRVLGSLMIKPDIFDSKPTVKVTVNDHKWGEINKDSVYLPNWVAGKKVMVQQSAKRVKLVQTNKKLIEKEKSYSIIFLSGALLTMFIFIMITKYKQGASL